MHRGTPGGVAVPTWGSIWDKHWAPLERGSRALPSARTRPALRGQTARDSGSSHPGSSDAGSASSLGDFWGRRAGALGSGTGLLTRDPGTRWGGDAEGTDPILERVWVTRGSQSLRKGL